MDLSTAMFGYLLVDIRSVDHDAPSAAATEPNGPKKGGGVTTRPFLSKSDTYVRDYPFRVSQVLNHFSRVDSGDSIPAYAQPIGSPNTWLAL